MNTFYNFFMSIYIRYSIKVIIAYKKFSQIVDKALILGYFIKRFYCKSIFIFLCIYSIITLGKYTDLITDLRVGYLNNISVRWNTKKKGCQNVPTTAKNPYLI